MSLLLSTLDANIIGLSNDDSTESNYIKKMSQKTSHKELFFDISRKFKEYES